MAGLPPLVLLVGNGVLRFFASVFGPVRLSGVAVDWMVGSGFGLNSGLLGAPAFMLFPNLGVPGAGTPIGSVVGGPAVAAVVAGLAEVCEFRDGLHGGGSLTCTTSDGLVPVRVCPSCTTR